MAPTQPLLQRQLMRHFGEGFQVPPEWQGFIAAVDTAYCEFEMDRELIERSLELSSKELLEANSELRAIFQAIPDTVFRLDRDGTILSVQAGSGSGMAQQKLSGFRIQESWLRHSGERFIGALRQVIQDKSTVSLEHAQVEEGQESVHEVRLVPLLQDQAVAIARNITERKRAEAMLAQSRAMLTRQAEELEVALQKAQSANRAKSSFLANMSHELRTPLNAILGYAQMLRRADDLSARQATAIATIQSSGEHLLTLINDILDLSKIEAGKLDLFPAGADLRGFLQSVADMVRIRAEDKAISFRFEPASDLPKSAEFDEKRLRQVLLNLLGNAVKFTDHGEVTLRVRRLAAEGDGGACLEFEVADSGIGIAESQISAIFEPFEQAGDPQQRAGGTGLGLSISRQLVRLMGGDIQAASKPGEGSRFWFQLRLPTMDAAPVPVQAEQIISGYLGPRRTVLVVDDKATNRAVLADMLEQIGFVARSAIDGSDCLARMLEAPPDLVLMDLRMPVMDGFEAIRRIRLSPGLSAIPVIAVSAGSDSGDSIAAGADAFIDKPVNLHRLLQFVASLLGLQWLYAAHSPGTAAESPPNDTQILVPPREEIAALHEHALAGDMRNIRHHAERIARLDPRFAPFAARLQQMAKGYQSKEILGLVEQHLRS